MSENNQPYRLVIIAVVALSAFGINFIHFQIAGLAPLIFQLTGATPQQFGLLMGLPLLGCTIIGIPFGALGDRYGVKLMVSIGIVFSLIGTIGRYFAEPEIGNYYFWMFLIGVSNGAINANFIKVIGVWLPPRQIGLGVGCYLAGIGLGQSGAVLVGSKFSALGPAFSLSVWVIAAVLVIWLVLLKPAPAGAPKMEPQPLMEGLRYVMAKPVIWVAGFCALFMLGAYVTLNSFLVGGLIAAKGVTPDKAAMAGSAVAFSLMIGSLVAAALAKAVGRSKAFLAGAGLISAVCVYLAWSVEYGGLTVALLFGAGFFSGAFLSFILSLPMLLSYIGPVYAGSAGGVISTLQTGGGFALPFLLPMMAGGSMDGIFTLVAAGFAVMAFLALAIPELLKSK
ncbi:MAG: MFS transporter [Deltaproteobacteria bacterium]|nr:MFS transporter [Deltaproteobacteria bacterium]